jgi:hypothetical protein
MMVVQEILDYFQSDQFQIDREEELERLDKARKEQICYTLAKIEHYDPGIVERAIEALKKNPYNFIKK